LSISKRKWSKEEKLAIIKKAEEHGVQTTLEHPESQPEFEQVCLHREHELRLELR